MWIQLLTIVATALLTSACTVGLGWWLYRRRLKAELEAQLEAATEQVDAKLQAALLALGEVVEERVKRGLIQGVAAIPSREVLAGTSRSAAKTGADLASRGLSALLGLGRSRKPEE